MATVAILDLLRALRLVQLASPQHVSAVVAIHIHIRIEAAPLAPRALFLNFAFVHQRNVSVQQCKYIAQAFQVVQPVLVHLAVLVERQRGRMFAMLEVVGFSITLLAALQVA